MRHGVHGNERHLGVDGVWLRFGCQQAYRNSGGKLQINKLRNEFQRMVNAVCYLRFSRIDLVVRSESEFSVDDDSHSDCITRQSGSTRRHKNDALR